MKVKMGDGSLNLKAGGSLANIDRGPRGYSAYEVAVQNGFVGSEAAWLASLVGPKGDTGATGERGVQGPRGQQGEKGDTGATGATGPSNVLSIGTVTGGAEAAATITGSSPEQVLNLVLPKGDKGDTGDTGATGADGYTPIKGIDYFTADDIASLNIPDSLSDLSEDSTHRVVTDAEKTSWSGKYAKPSGGIPATDLTSQVQTSLGKADTALQRETYTGTITSVKMNGTTVATSGEADLGTVITGHQDISGKEDKTNKVTSLSSSSTDAQYPSAKCVYDSQEAQNTVIGSKANSSDVYTKSEAYSKSETDTLLNGKQNTLTFDTTPTENSTNPVTSGGIYNNQAEQDANISALQNLVTQLPRVTGTGTNLSLNPTLNYKIMKSDLKGNSSQDGIPTTSTPYPIKVVTGENSLVIQNKNLFDKTDYDYLDNANVSSSSIINIENNFALIYINLPAGTYTISNSIGSYQWLISDCEDTPAIGVSTNPRQVTTGTSVTYTMNSSDYLLIRVAKNTVSIADFVNNLQIEKGSQATSYVAHQEQLPYPISLGNIELCKIGDYQDYIYKNGDNWYVKKLVNKLTVDSSFGTSAGGDFNTMKTNGYICRYTTNYPAAINSNRSLIYCNILKGVTNTLWNGANGEGIQLGTSNSSMNMAINFNTIENYYGSTLTSQNYGSAFVSYLISKNATIYYPTNSPTDIQITDTTLIEQLNNFYNNVYSYNGTTNITSTCETGNEQMYLDFGALMDLNNLVDRIETIESEV